MFAEITPEHVISFGTIVTTLIAALAWISRSVIPTLLETYRADVAKAHEDCKEEREKIAAQHNVEILRRDEILRKLTTAVNRVLDRIDALPDQVVDKLNSKSNPKDTQK
jgi:hypothetical protein